MSNASLPSARLSTLALRLGMCAVALAGTVAMVPQAQAVVVTFSTPISVPNNFDGLYLNLLTGGTGTTGASTPGWDINLYNSGVTLSLFWSATPSQASGVAATATGPYLDLAPGAVVSSASTFAQVTAGTATAAFQTVGTHTLGFRFYNESTTAINYGYMTLVSGGTTGFPLTVSRWSFENSGGAITVPSVVPEPASGALLAAGAVLLGAVKLRRQRRRQAA